MKRKIVSMILVIVVIGLMALPVMAASDVQATTGGAVKSYNLPLNYTVNDQIDDEDEERQYKISLSKEGYIYVNFNHKYIESNYEPWAISIYNEEMEELASEAMYAKTTKNTMTKIGVPAGTYYIRVELYRYGYGDGIGIPYNLKVNFKAASNWETEFNDTYQTADAISFNKVRYGSCMCSDDNDFYKVKLPKPGYFDVNFNHKYIESNYEPWAISIYNEEMEKLTSEIMYAKTTKNTMTKIGVPAGTYYIRVELYRYGYDDGVGIPYNLKVNYKAASNWETEFNDTYQTADPLSLNKAKYGTSMYSGDDDYYKVKATKTKRLNFKFSHGYSDTNSTYWTIRYYNAAMKQLGDGYEIRGNKTSDTMSRKVASGKTYYIRVQSHYDYPMGYTYNLKAFY